MQKNHHIADSTLQEAPEIRSSVSRNTTSMLDYILPYPLPQHKAVYIDGIHKKLQMLKLSGILASDHPVFSRTFRAFSIKCSEYTPLSPEQVSKTYSSRAVDKLMLDLAANLESLHRHNILLLSISPNFLLTNHNSDHPACALCGFLDAVDLNALPDEISLYEPVCAAPEVLQSPEKKTLTPVSDIYSLGMLYHLYMTGTLPEAQDIHEKAVNNRTMLRLSSRLDIPHKLLLSRMLSPEPAQRPQSMAETIREINRFLRYGRCFLQVDFPDLANRFVTLNSQGIFCIRKKLNQNGQVMIGPLLSDQEYTISFQNNVSFQVRFPKREERQMLRLSMDDQLSDVPVLMEQRDIQQPPVWEQEIKPSLIQDTIQDTIVLDPPLNNICRIDWMRGSFCLLTLINGGTFWIRTEAAPRYGIDHVLRRKRGG